MSEPVVLSARQQQIASYERMAQYQLEEAARFEKAVTCAAKKKYHECMARYYSTLCEKSQHTAAEESLDADLVSVLSEEAARCAKQYGQTDAARVLADAVKASKLPKEEAEFLIANGLARAVCAEELQ